MHIFTNIITENYSLAAILVLFGGRQWCRACYGRCVALFNGIARVGFEKLAALIAAMSLIAPGYSQLTFNASNQSPSLCSGHPSEKIFVHTDKSFYMQGEIIWFKVYCADAATNKLTSVSKVAYAELLDRQNNTVFHAKIALNNGTGNGSFFIPATIRSGSYTFRAYTHWMKNFDAGYFFNKTITIVNALKRPDWQALQTEEKYDVQFFPEGGELVRNITSKIAFKVTDANGRGVGFNGFLLNQNNDTVERFRPQHFGIGSFTLRPTGDQYHAAIRLNNGKVITSSFPDVKDQGYVINLQTRPQQPPNIVVKGSANVVGSKVYLVHSIADKTVSVVEKDLQPEGLSFPVDESLLSDGINYLTLLNAQQQPVCERLFFKPPSQQIQLSISTNQKEYDQRAKVEVSISANDRQNHPLAANLSISVCLLDSLQTADESNIVASMLFSGLKGRVQEPQFYLQNMNSDTGKTAIDNLMLTHGWRKFTPVANSAVRRLPPEYEGMTISGQVTDKRTNKPAAGVLCYLSIPGERYLFANAVSDSNGGINFVVEDFYGDGQLVAQTADENYAVNISEQFALTEPGGASAGAFNLPQNRQQLLATKSMYAQLQNAFEKENRERFTPPTFHDTLPFYGVADRKYFLDDYTRFPTMEEVLLEFVTDVKLRKQGDGWRIAVRNIPYRQDFESDPLVLVDGVPEFNMKKVAELDPLKIKKIEVVTKKFYYRNLVNSGILSYQTYNGDLAGFSLNPNATVMNYQGLQIERQFYSPVYDMPEKISSTMADVRNVLYWNPAVLTGNKGVASGNFYTSDLPGTYAIVVQGLANNGLSGYGLNTVVVRPKK